MDREIEDLCRRLASLETVGTALVDAAAVSDRWASRQRTGDPGPLADETARGLLRTTLVDCLEVDRTRPIGSTVVWVLGKLFDASLETYYADLVALYVQSNEHYAHLHQVLIALDNLGAIDPSEYDEGGWANTPDSFPRMHRIGLEYLRKRRPDR